MLFRPEATGSKRLIAAGQRSTLPAGHRGVFTPPTPEAHPTVEIAPIQSPAERCHLGSGAVLRPLRVSFLRLQSPAMGPNGNRRIYRIPSIT